MDEWLGKYNFSWCRKNILCWHALHSESVAFVFVFWFLFVCLFVLFCFVFKQWKILCAWKLAHEDNCHCILYCICMENMNRLQFKYLCIQYFIRIVLMTICGADDELFVYTSVQDFELLEMLYRWGAVPFLRIYWAC